MYDDYEGYYTFGYESKFYGQYIIYTVPASEVIHMYEDLLDDTVEIVPTVSLDYFEVEYFRN
jgi:hypothetical protein